MADRVFGTSKKRATSQKSNRHLGKTLRAAVDKFLLDRESRNLSHKAMVQHRTSLTHLLKFLELQHQVTHLTELEPVHLRAWLVFLAKEPTRGKLQRLRTARTCRWYAQSMHAFRILPKRYFGNESCISKKPMWIKETRYGANYS